MAREAQQQHVQVASHGVVPSHDHGDGLDFETYVRTYNRQYEPGSKEYLMRHALFEQRKAEIAAHNSRAGRLWTAGVNHFTDQTEEERARARGWKHISTDAASSGHSAEGEASLLESESDDEDRLGTLPEAAHWLNLNSSRRTIDQGGCGSCWAVTSASVLDAHYEIHHGATRKFSPQELVSCVPNPHFCGGSGGCDGATVELAMAYVKAHGLHSEVTVPYDAADKPCHAARPSASSSNSLVDKLYEGAHTITSWQMLPRNKDEPLLKALYQYGPVGVSLAAGGLHDYAGGIFDKCHKDCVVDHATTLYGYGKEHSRQYWLIKNSWGRSWGEQGYFRLLRQHSPTCGTDRSPQEGTGCRGGPSEVQVCGMCGILYDSVVPYMKGKGSHHSKKIHPATDVPWSLARDASFVEADGRVLPSAQRRWRLADAEDDEASSSLDVVATPADALGDDGLEDAVASDYDASLVQELAADSDTSAEVTASGQPLIRRRVPLD
eukprot:CAMPEP_0178432638 /NCGR_PEP_ID=MMETSP0689_2-20121128/32492_1 /TAXON_ID=160604 /ORGANISM="Amphidinium massartii, Strain CS-259" /LENGTH=493 /DNA_ID=CAMNT_0020054639 /DNA_START=166 /DNA_END=1647 /DNA_ORIENTATION=+